MLAEKQGKQGIEKTRNTSKCLANIFCIFLFGGLYCIFKLDVKKNLICLFKISRLLKE